MLSQNDKTSIRDSFVKGTLRIQSVSPEGILEWKRVVSVVRNAVPWETIFRGETEFGSFVLTGGHRVFTSPTTKKDTELLTTGDSLLGVAEGKVGSPALLTLSKIENRQFMYDLTAQDWHNFVLHGSKIVVSNSPDKFYHFRPPEHEGKIGVYNRVFGQIWEDAELCEYLERAISWWDMFPPATYICSIENLVNMRPQWMTAIYWAAIVHAMFAVSANWIADEFDYSIGGISLSLEKSSKYESLKSNAEGQFDKASEAKARTVKYIRGLQQPKYGLGVRSSFGGNLGRGVLSPRSFI